jgi:hypothetical protein
MLLAEQRDQGFIDLRPGAGSLVQENRHLLMEWTESAGNSMT